MSWDIVLFNSKQIINTITELNKNLLEPTDFSGILENSFDRIKKDNNHREIIGINFTIEFLRTKNIQAILCFNYVAKKDFMN
jgi:hypothetical protein